MAWILSLLIIVTSAQSYGGFFAGQSYKEFLEEIRYLHEVELNDLQREKLEAIVRFVEGLKGCYSPSRLFSRNHLIWHGKAWILWESSTVDNEGPYELGYSRSNFNMGLEIYMGLSKFTLAQQRLGPDFDIPNACALLMREMRL